MIKLLPATRTDDEGRRLAAIQRFGPPVKAGIRLVGLSLNPAVWCELGRRCISRRIRGGGVVSDSHSGRSSDPVTPDERCQSIFRQIRSAMDFERPFAEARFQCSRSFQ